MQNTSPVNFKGYMYGKLIYEVAGKTRERITPKGVWMCNKGNNTLVKKIIKLAKDKEDIVTITREVIDNEKNLVFEIPKELFFKTNSYFQNLMNDINSEPLQRKLLENKNIKTIIFKLPKSHLESLKKYGPDYDYSQHNFDINLFDFIAKAGLDKRLKKFAHVVQEHFKAPEEKSWLKEFFSNVL